jgi:diguanylate cyclase (GGDEF)-like protein
MLTQGQSKPDRYTLAYTYSMGRFYEGLSRKFFLEFAIAVVALFFAYLPIYLFFNYKILPSLFTGLQTDGLTQLMDRKLFVEICKLKLLRAQEASDNYCLCILDIDDFKRINDTYGHGVGDVVLSEVGAIIKSNTRDYFDCSSRYGGEEFAILYRATAKDAVDLLNRLRHQIEMYDFNRSDQPVRITISAGFSSTSKSGYSLEVLMRSADEFLYKSKFKGKNKVTGA